MRKKPLSAASTLGLLAGPQAREQRLGAEVDEHHFVGAAEDRIRDRLAHARALSSATWSLSDSRCWTLTVESVDAGVQNVLDVLVALLVLQAGRVGMGQLVLEHELQHGRMAGRSMSEVGAPVGDPPLRHDRQSLRQGLRLRAPWVSRKPDDDVAPGLLLGVRLEQHAIGLADPAAMPRKIV
jgi:hypothetical protein